MSVYTRIGRDELSAWLQPLALGALIDHAGIAAGMQNSNYFVTTAAGRFVLTVFERIDIAALDFYLGLMEALADRQIPCPKPVADAAGRHWRLLAGKPAALLSCLPGKIEEEPTASQCRALGSMLARLHHAGQSIGDPLPNPCGAAWRRQVGEQLLPRLLPAERALLADELAFQALQNFSMLPSGVIHADLFRDNVLWDEAGQLSGILDFYFAGEDSLLFDLAVVANDWCFNHATLTELIAGYISQRPLDELEMAAWPAMQRAAALRFWLLRLEVRHYPRGGEVVTIKDPDQFAQLLQRLRLAPQPLPR